jgi:N-methylhydantoinase B
VLFAPVFYHDQLIAISSTIAHHVDIGGKAPCTTVPDNTELFGEGLIFPPMRLMTAGAPNQAIFDMLAANVRNPQASLGDLRAQIAGCRIGERRLEEIATTYGH